MKNDRIVHNFYKILGVSTLAIGVSIGAANVSGKSLGLALVLDGSGSISPSDFALQTGAYQSIFQDSFYTNYVAPSMESGDSLYMGVYQFSTGVVREVGYTRIDSDTSAYAFGSEFSKISQQYGATNTAAATNMAASDLVANKYTNKVIDISTDGVPTYGGNAITAANQAKQQGVRVNALGVGGIDTNFLQQFTKAGGGFYSTAPDFTEFSNALSKKLTREIKSSGNASAVPEIDVAGATLGIPLLASLMLIFRERKRNRRVSSC
ncbi:DUF1194 domain-containing protein [Ketobacter sp.]